MLKRYALVREDQPEAVGSLRSRRKEAERWYQGEGRADPPTPAQCRAALREHMPDMHGYGELDS